MERIIKLRPSWDRRNSDPNKNYGIRAVNMDFILRGQEGAMVFIVYTGWYLPQLIEEGPFLTYYPSPVCINYHWRERKDEEDYFTEEGCEYLDTAPCYGSTQYSGLPEELLGLLIAKGSDAVWERMEAAYYNYLTKHQV